ncbi:MAG: hypothetical protein CMK41_01800 [Porticoccaceae bacterium]|nr:hypothetical protein [Porticoccaceae bacterium]|tara:strand:+ start:1187 stop:1876 length:690 start_codon:yes stop_codon:yes gene_type:complete
MKLSDSKSPEYSTHNFSAVDNQILEIAKREKARTFAYRVESAKMIMLYLGVGALIFAVMIYVLSWAYRTIMAPYVTEKVEIVQPEIVDREVIKVVKVPVIVNENSELKADDEFVVTYNGPSITSESEINVVTNYNIFRTVETGNFSTYGVNSVVTGWRYSSSEDSFPSYQFCYAHKLDKGKSAPLRIDLGNIDIDGGYYSSVTRDLSRDVSIPISVLKKMEDSCNWASI